MRWIQNLFWLEDTKPIKSTGMRNMIPKQKQKMSPVRGQPIRIGYSCATLLTIGWQNICFLGMWKRTIPEPTLTYCLFTQKTTGDPATAETSFPVRCCCEEEGSIQKGNSRRCTDKRMCAAHGGVTPNWVLPGRLCFFFLFDLNESRRHHFQAVTDRFTQNQLNWTDGNSCAFIFRSLAILRQLQFVKTKKKARRVDEHLLTSDVLCETTRQIAHDLARAARPNAKKISFPGQNSGD